MIISEKQILSLLRMTEAYSMVLHQFGEHKSFKIVQDLLAEINDQQSKELKEIE